MKQPESWKPSTLLLPTCASYHTAIYVTSVWLPPLFLRAGHTCSAAAEKEVKKAKKETIRELSKTNRDLNIIFTSLIITRKWQQI